MAPCAPTGILNEALFDSETCAKTKLELLSFSLKNYSTAVNHMQGSSWATFFEF